MLDKQAYKLWIKTIIITSIITSIIAFIYAKKTLTLNKDIPGMNTSLYMIYIFVGFIGGLILGSIIGYIVKLIFYKTSKDDFRI